MHFYFLLQICSSLSFTPFYQPGGMNSPCFIFDAGVYINSGHSPLYHDVIVRRHKKGGRASFFRLEVKMELNVSKRNPYK